LASLYAWKLVELPLVLAIQLVMAWRSGSHHACSRRVRRTQTGTANGLYAGWALACAAIATICDVFAALGEADHLSRAV
jgi:hypothetical protein